MGITATMKGLKLQCKLDDSFDTDDSDMRQYYLL